jgi:hypothetical protein
VLDIPPSSGFLNCSQSQLPASNSNTSQRLNPSSSLTATQSQSRVTIDSQSAGLSWCKTASGAQAQIFVTVRQLRVCSYGAPSLTGGQVCHLQLLLANTVIFTAYEI